MTLGQRSPDSARAPLAAWRQPWVAGLVTAFAIAVTAALAVGVFFLSIREVLLDDLRRQLRATAEMTAALIPGSEVAQFTDSSQTDSPGYLATSAPLAALLAANRDLRFAYVGRIRGDSMFFVLDGDRTADRAYVMQLDTPTDGELQVARSGKTVVEQKPSPNVWGVGIRAYAPIAGAPGTYVGVTLNAKRYDVAVSEVFRAAALGLAVATVLAILGGVRTVRTERTQRRAAAELLEARSLAAEAAEERLALVQRLQNRHRMEALGTLAGGVAHDFNNLLMVVLGQAEMISETAPPQSSTAASAEAIRIATVRARDLIRRILLFARSETDARSPVPLGSLVEETVQLLRSSLPGSARILWQPPSEPIAAVVEASTLSQVLMNLAVNARDALRDGGGTIAFALDEVKVGRDDQARLGLDPGRYARIVVRDDGIGISGEIRARIFEPFFTTKPAGKGSGLGLAVADGVIRGFGGVIEVDSELGAGSAFSIYLPAWDRALATPSEAVGRNANPMAPMVGRRVLLVDDDEMVLEITSRILERAGYRVAAHSDPDEALRRLAADPEGFAVLITDRTMPALSGPEVARRARALSPALPIVLLTGAGHPADEESTSFAAAVLKPVERAALLRTIDEVLGAAART
ncbi:MAG: ATP-binding protein [Gemmatimonadales bacterium]